jgi:uncharacterized protein (TIGR03032 family)
MSTDATPPFRYVLSDSMPALLAELNCTLAATTYQAGKLLFFRSDGERISALMRTFESAMGLAVSPDRLALGSRNCIWILRNAPDVGRQMEPRGSHDACFVPRTSHVTGDIRIHELAWGGDTGGDLHFVNTRFSCLCTLHPDYSFVPRWRPPFVTALAGEDRCHLNGLAMLDGKPRYVTALGETDDRDGWRANKVSGGIVIDVAHNEIVARDLSMPHSPRIHEGKLWVLNSGTGELQIVDPGNGKRETIIALPGYTRSLAFAGPYAFVGLSRIRETSTFGGLPIAARIKELECGVYAIDTRSARVAGFLKFDAGCEEIFDLQILPGMRWPALIGLEKETINGVFIAPPDAWKGQGF